MTNNNGPFPFRSTMEAWKIFTKAAKFHFMKLIQQESKKKPKIKDDLKLLPNMDYCARLIYILNMFGHEGDNEIEFDIDWAMLVAKPLSADQARRSLQDLIKIGLINEIKDSRSKNDKDGNGNGGSTNTQTKFDFD